MKTGVLFIGYLGVNSTTFCSAITAMAKGLIKDEGCVSCNDEFKHLNLVTSEDIVFGGWDPVASNMYDSVCNENIVPIRIVELIKEKLINKQPYSAIMNPYFDHSSLTKHSNIYHYKNLKDALDKIANDIFCFKKDNELNNCIVIYMGSPLRTLNENVDHESHEGIIKLINSNRQDLIPPSIIYALAAIQEKCAFIDFTPNQTLNLKGVQEAAMKYSVPIAGRDGSTGQTLMKSLIAEMLKIRNFNLEGWYSTNIIGNNDGKVLSDPDFVETKLNDKMCVLEPILGYSDFDHIVDIKYYKPRGDNKESWDNIDFSGLFNLPMSIKINWQGRDSLLAMPMIYDLIKFMAFEKERGNVGLQSHLGWFFKNPLGASLRGFWQLYSLLVKHYSI